MRARVYACGRACMHVCMDAWMHVCTYGHKHTDVLCHTSHVGNKCQLRIYSDEYSILGVVELYNSTLRAVLHGSLNSHITNCNTGLYNFI